MATYKTANHKGKYYDEKARGNVISYILDDEKMIHNFFGGVHVNEHDIVGSMNQISEYFHKESGVQIRHFIISFNSYETNNPSMVNEIAMQAVRFLGKAYQTIYAVHENTDFLHIHIAMNPISYIDGHRYRGTKAEHYEFVNFLRGILKHYGITKLQYVSSKEG